MPKPRIREALTRERFENSPAVKTCLELGHYFSFTDDTLCSLHPDGFSDEDLRMAWEVLGPELTQEAIQKTPGERPWAAWVFNYFREHGGRRLLRPDSTEPFESRSLPCILWHHDDYERSVEYLDRCGLMDHEELLRRRAQDIKKGVDNLHPFRRPPSFWLVDALEPRNPEVSETEQLMAMKTLNDRERLIMQDPRAARTAGGSKASRFWLKYLEASERELLQIDRPLEEPEPTVAERRQFRTINPFDIQTGYVGPDDWTTI